MTLTHPVAVNPFRAPLRQPRVNGGSVGFPWLSNGFIAGLNAPTLGDEHRAVRAATLVHDR